MALTTEQQTALANERRYQELKRKEARLLGAVETMQSLRQTMGGQVNASMSALTATKAEITQLEAGSGGGLSDEFGPYSALEQAMRVERFAGKAATIDFIKANPECLMTEALAAYEVAALAARPEDEQFLIQNPAGLLQKYAKDAATLGAIPVASWETFRAMVVATDKDVLMGM